MPLPHRPFLALLLALLLGGLCLSCRTFYDPAFVLQLHEFSDTRLATKLVSQIRTPDFAGQQVVKKYPFLSSRGLCAGEIVGPAENGKYGLRLQIDKWNADSTNQIAGNYFGMAYAVSLDGVYVGYSHFNREMRDSNIFEIEPIFSRHDAELIVSRIVPNYEYFNEK